MFATVLHSLNSPQNTGMIVRTHVAFGGEKLVMIGAEPWRFKKGSQAFSRKLERLCDIVHLTDDESFFNWCQSEDFVPVAIEIAERSISLPSFAFPKRPAIVVGNEGRGLHESFLKRCAHVVTIPQFGPVECLNTAASCCIAIYEFSRLRADCRGITGSKFSAEVNRVSG